MTKLERQIEATLLPGMHLPEPLRLLFRWIEEHGFYHDEDNGRRVGYLFSDAEQRAGTTETERPGGTDILFYAEGNLYLKHWFGHNRPEVLNRLCVFARTGAEGSMGAFWLDPDGRQRIVHMGSGGGMVCVLADDAVDFLRLIAIGYDEICRGEVLSEPPNAFADEDEIVVHPNRPYQDWVRTTFGVEIPRTGAEIVRHIPRRREHNSPDPFNRWVAANVG